MIAALLKTFFHFLYHGFAWGYDAVAALVSFGRWKGWVYSAVPSVEGPRVLELGHGPGHLLVHLDRAGFNGFGVDESRQMSDMASRLLRAKVSSPALRLARAHGQALPFAGTCFQTVVSTFPAPYITSPEALCEIHRVLAPGGKLVILLAAWITGRSLVDRALALLFRVTGETPQLDDEKALSLLSRFTSAGFDARLEWLDQPSSRLLYIYANKV